MPPQKWERREGQASLAQTEVRASLERLEAALAPEGGLGLGAADSARLRWGGLLPAEAWAARLQRQTEVACKRALERLCGSAPADVAAPTTFAPTTDSTTEPVVADTAAATNDTVIDVATAALTTSPSSSAVSSHSDSVLMPSSVSSSAGSEGEAAGGGAGNDSAGGE